MYLHWNSFPASLVVAARIRWFLSKSDTWNFTRPECFHEVKWSKQLSWGVRWTRVWLPGAVQFCGAEGQGERARDTSSSVYHERPEMLQEAQTVTLNVSSKSTLPEHSISTTEIPDTGHLLFSMLFMCFAYVFFSFFSFFPPIGLCVTQSMCFIRWLTL